MPEDQESTTPKDRESLMQKFKNAIKPASQVSAERRQQNQPTRGGFQKVPEEGVSVILPKVATKKDKTVAQVPTGLYPGFTTSGTVEKPKR
jgi:hypothetical protein